MTVAMMLRYLLNPEKAGQSTVENASRNVEDINSNYRTIQFINFHIFYWSKCDNGDMLMRTEELDAPKVTFEQIRDFKFKVAYEAYSNLFDKTHEIKERHSLNTLISQLSNKEISYQQFYGEINRYRGGADRTREFSRMRIQGQKKRDYRRDEQKKQRIKRHKR